LDLSISASATFLILPEQTNVKHSYRGASRMNVSFDQSAAEIDAKEAAWNVSHILQPEDEESEESEVDAYPNKD